MKITIEDCEIEVDCTQCDTLTAENQRLKAALKRAESAMHDHHMHGRTVDFAAAIAEAREAVQ